MNEEIKNENKKHKTFISAFVISFGVLLSRFSGLIRDIFFAKYLGTGIVAEAFYVAFRLPNTFRRIFAEGALSNAFVPFFSSRVIDDKKQANKFSGKILVILFSTLILLTILMEIFMPQIIRLINPGFIKDAEKYNLAVQFSRISFPYIILISITSFFGSILNSIGSFWQFASISLVLNFGLVVGLFVSGLLSTNIGYCLSWMMIASGILQLFLLAYSCIKRAVFPNLRIFKKENNKNKTKEQIETEIKEEKFEIKQFLKKLCPAIISSGILQINIFVDGIFASFFAGAVSYLYYTDRIGQFPLSIIGYSLSVAILPSLSIAFKNENKQEISILQRQSFNIAMFFSIPAMLLIFTTAKQIIYTIYERGAFTSNDTEIVGKMLSIYAISIPFNVLLKIFFSCFYAQKDTKTPMRISTFALLFNIIFNLLFMKIAGMYCVVMATSMSAVLSCCLAFYTLQKKGFLFIDIFNIKYALQITAVSLISCVLCPVLMTNINDLFWTLYIGGVLHIIFLFVFKVITKDFVFSILKKYWKFKRQKKQNNNNYK